MRRAAGTVTVIDVATDRPVVHLKTGGRPRGIQVSADGRTVYVARCDPEFRKQNAIDAILAIDVAKKKVIAKFDGGSDPEQFAVSRDSGHLYVANGLSGDVSVIETTIWKVIATIPVGQGPWGVAISP